MAHTAWTAERLRKEQPYIKCKNLAQQKIAIKHLEFLGFSALEDTVGDELIISVYWSNFSTMNMAGDTNCPVIFASEFLNTPPPNPELQALKKRLIEIADSDRNDAEKNYQYEGHIFNFMAYNNWSNTHATDLANLIINSDI